MNLTLCILLYNVFVSSIIVAVAGESANIKKNNAAAHYDMEGSGDDDGKDDAESSGSGYGSDDEDANLNPVSYPGRAPSKSEKLTFAVFTTKATISLAPTEKTRILNEPVDDKVRSTDSTKKMPHEKEIAIDTIEKTSTTGDNRADTNGGVYMVNTPERERTTSFFAQPGILAAVIGGAVVGLLCAILVVMFIVYRMRKKDEGSYALEEMKRCPATNPYMKPNHREFFA